MMITSEQAIEKAFGYIKSQSEHLDVVDSPRLESVQLFGDDWVVTLSYFTERKTGDSPALNSLLQALSYQRSFKEIEINATNGEIIGMTNPTARPTEPVTS